MNWFMRGLLALVLVSASASAGTPYPTRHTPKAEDLGRLRELASNQKITATVSLSLRNPGKLQDLVADLYDRTGSNYRRFLSGEQFRSEFGPGLAQIRQVTSDLRAAGLSVELVNGTLLRATGTVQAMEKAFSVELHSFRIADATGEILFHAPTSAARIRPEWEGIVQTVVGLDTRPRFSPMRRDANAKTRPSSVRPSTAAPNTPDAPGAWTVIDFAKYYDVNPLYSAGEVGKGKTIGIVTLASFRSKDAFDYWDSLGLKTSANRLTVVEVDNGSGKPSDDSGSDETTLDVEQSGGIAPGAKLIVYEAPNTDQGFVDAFATAIEANQADAISTSWGEWEALLEGDTVQSPESGRTVDELKAYHDLFIQAAVQGQSLFAAAGDDGALDGNDANGDFPLPQFTQVLAVDHPASDPFMTAAGGTTLPGEQTFTDASGNVYTVNVPSERAWSWDYLNAFCASIGYDPIDCGIFPAGGGGGVSVEFDRPWYQDNLDGIVNSAKGQSLVDTSQTPPETLIKLPANFAGRNVPDISFNADPDTGYVLLYTADADKKAGTGPGTYPFSGGTSFVAPQLAGVTVLVDGYAGGRVGLLNAPLYELARIGWLYSGKFPAARDIVKGNNDGYKAAPGYDQASGLGVLDVANFAALFR